MQVIIAWILVLAGSLHALLPAVPKGDKLNLDGYELAFCDEFEGEELDDSVWYCRFPGDMNAGHNSLSQVSVSNGKLTITGEYLEDGEYGAGYYSASIALRQKYTTGYFEIKCKCADSRYYWSAFWLQSGTSYDNEISAGGVGGAEIDIFEAMESRYFPFELRNSVKTTIYCNGSDALPDRIDRQRVGKYYVGNLYDEYHTFGLKWTEEEYIFYIDGIESGRSSFGKGVSTVPEEVIVSLEIPKTMLAPHDHVTTYDVDYVKIWSAV